MPDPPRRGDIWFVDLGEPRGHEAGFERPGLIVSADEANRHGLVVVCPIGTARRGYPTRIELDGAGLGLAGTSYVQAEQVRTISSDRCVHRLGLADGIAMMQVDRVLRYLLDL